MMDRCTKRCVVFGSASEVASTLHCDAANGLTDSDALARQTIHGRNELEAEEPVSACSKFLAQLKEPLVLLLFGSAIVSCLVGQYDDAISISLAVMLISVVAYVQERRSEQTLEALQSLVPPRAVVVRGGRAAYELKAVELVPGDVVLIAAGDRVPADCRVLECVQLLVDESSLTGESEAVKKRVEQQQPNGSSEENCGVSECGTVVFAGTYVRGGRGRCAVVCTGMKTEFGRAAAEMKELEPGRTPLQQGMDDLGRRLSAGSIGLIVVMGLIGVARGESVLEVFQVGVSLAVAAIPEGLPICVAVTLALGVMRIARRNAVVKRLPAIEALGCTNVICVDKTGTLTRNEMALTEASSCDGWRLVRRSDEQYEVARDETHDDWSPVRTLPEGLRKCLDACCLCSNATLHSGMPTEVALLAGALALGVPDRRGTTERVHETAFDSSTKKMEVHIAEGRTRVYTKGALEYVVDPAKYPQEARRATEMAGRGLRVLAVAVSEEGSEPVLLGVLGMSDPPRDTALSAVRALQSRGTRIVMLTGDSRETALAIARQVGIPTDETLSGNELEAAMKDTTNDALICGVSVLYRVSPRHKLDLVRLLQRNGAVVAMTGDGVNDAPALRAADVGVAMGLRGTDVASEAADVVLADDDLSSIVAAVDEGKAIFHNIRNFVTFQLSTSLAALGIVTVAKILGLPRPLNAMQVLWINIIMDGPPAQSLGVEPVDLAVTREPPRSREESIITPKMALRVITSALLVCGGTLAVFAYEVEKPSSPEHDTTMTFTTFVLFDMFNALACRSDTALIGSSRAPLMANTAFCLAISLSLLGQVVVVYFPPARSIFQTEALSLSDVIKTIMVSSSVLGLDITRKLYNRSSIRFALPRCCFFPKKNSKQPNSSLYRVMSNNENTHTV